MPSKAARPGSAKGKKGPSVGTGGHGRKRLEGKALPLKPKIAKATRPSELKSLPTRKKLRGFE